MTPYRYVYDTKVYWNNLLKKEKKVVLLNIQFAVSLFSVVNTNEENCG